MNLDTRWPLAALPVTAFDPWFAGRVALYDLAVIVDAEPAHAPSRAAMVCDALRSLPAGDCARALLCLDASGAAAVVVGVMVGAVLRAESERQPHAFCCGPTRKVAASLMLRGIVTVRAGAA